MTRSVIAMANTPSEKVSILPVSLPADPLPMLTRRPPSRDKLRSLPHSQTGTQRESNLSTPGRAQYANPVLVRQFFQLRVVVAALTQRLEQLREPGYVPDLERYLRSVEIRTESDALDSDSLYQVVHVAHHGLYGRILHVFAVLTQ